AHRQSPPPRLPPPALGRSRLSLSSSRKPLGASVSEPPSPEYADGAVDVSAATSYRALRDGVLELEQVALAFDAAAVLAQCAAAAQHPMAGDDDGDRVGGNGVADGARGARRPDLACTLAVRRV